MAEIIQPAPFMRRLGAAFYDVLLLLGIWIGITFVAVFLNGGEPVASGSRLFAGTLIGISLIFNAWFWTHGGQTLGMRAWRLQVRKEVDSGPVGWGRASWRFLIALFGWGCFGLGVLWALAHPQNKTWQDLLSGTETVLLPPPSPDQQLPE